MTPLGRHRRRVLFIGHEASRTGAPIMLLHLLRWLRRNTDVDFDVVLRAGGDLLDDYRKVATVFVMDERKAWGRMRKVTDRLRTVLRVPDLQSPRCLRSLFRGRDIGLVYSNTVINEGALGWFSALNCPVLCHAHEVEVYFRWLSPFQVQRIKHFASRYLVVCEEGRSNLLRCGIAPEHITLVPGFMPVGAVTSSNPERRRAFRGEHRIPEDAILVGGCGTPDWQKGPDLLVHLANALARRPASRPLHFAWVGGKQTDPGYIQLAWDIARSNLAANFTLLPSMFDPAPYFQSLDVFALTSRNDPLPLVAIEAGSHGLPVICFAGSAELVDDECGIVVPYLDLERFAQAIRDLAEDDRLRTRLGERLSTKVRACHDVSVGAPRIAEIIRSFLRADT